MKYLTQTQAQNLVHLVNPVSIPLPSSALSVPSVVKKFPTQFSLRPYQQAAFNSTHGIEIWLWARQTGKSHTLAAWAIHRLLTRPGRLVTILSNSKQNGIHLNQKIAHLCDQLRQQYQQLDLSPDPKFESFNTETRISIQNQIGRIKILAANPRTARGFSGDLILDEFAFHENAQAIWEAAEPILAANPDYQCRIASTPNGKYNYFYELCTNNQIPVQKITRTDAWTQGCDIFHPITRAKITPQEARALAPNKPAYDQNYECSFNDTNFSLLTHELISSAESQYNCPITETDWHPDLFSLSAGGERRGEVASLPNEKCQIINAQCSMNLYAGIDVARTHDLTVITLLSHSRSTNTCRIEALLRLKDMRLPDQQHRLNQILSLPNLIHAKLDMTGLGLGLLEYTQQKFPNKITGLNFSSTVPLPSLLSVSSVPSVPSVVNNSLSPRPTVRITEYLATQLLQTFEDRRLTIPIDPILRDDLRKPQRIVTASGQVQIAAARDASGHADHFWSLALAMEAAKQTPRPPFHHTRVPLPNGRGTKAPRRHHFFK